MLDLHRSRQQDVGVARGVGHEVIDDHGEQVVARQAAAHAGLVRDAGRRVGGQHQQRLHRRIAAIEQAFPEPGHVQGPGRPGAKVVAPQRRPVDAEEPARVVVDAAAGMAPVAGDPGDAGDRAHRHPTAAVALQADADADAGGPGVGDPPAQLHDRRDRQPGDRRHAIGRVLEDALAERVPAHRVPVDEVAILGALAQHDVQQPERERRVGAGQRRKVPVAGGGGARPHRIDGDDLRALAARLEDRAPQVRMRRQHVGAPDDDQLRAAQRFRIHADAVVAERVAGAEAPGDHADGLDVLRGAERVPQPPAGAVGAVEQAHVAGADIRPDGLTAVGGDDLAAGAPRCDRGPRPR